MDILVAGIHWKTSNFLANQKRVKISGVLRWVSSDGNRYFEWDALHGEIEVFNKRGKHIAVLNANGTLSNKVFVAGRTIDV